MADPATVEVIDDAIVTIEVVDDGGVVAPAAVAVAAKETVGAADEAAAKLNAAVKAAGDERKRRESAEATANSERQRADAATRQAAASREEVESARETAATNALQFLTTSIDTATKAVAAAKVQFKAAFDAGDADKIADAQQAIADATVDLKTFTIQKAELESGATRRPAHDGRVEPLASPLTPQEQYITGNNFSPTAQTWLRSHPECLPAAVGGSSAKNAAMMEGHYAALRQDVAVNSTKYFEIIEEHAGYREPTSAAADTIEAGVEPPAQRQPQRKPVPAAPANNEPLAAAPSAKRSVKLSPQQQEVALFSYPANPGENEAAHRNRAFGTYATELVAATAEGKIGRMTH